jgi:hypothetical protein
LTKINNSYFLYFLFFDKYDRISTKFYLFSYLFIFLKNLNYYLHIHPFDLDLNLILRIFNLLEFLKRTILKEK